MNPQILEYIRVQRAAGNPDDIIAQNLRATGWPEDMIAQGLQSPSTIPPQAPLSSVQTGSSLIGVFRLLDDAIKLVRSRLTTVVLLGAIAATPSLVMIFFPQVIELFAKSTPSITTIVLVVGLIVILVILSSLLSAISTIGIITVLADRNRNISFSEAFMIGLHKFIPFTWVLFLTGFIIMGGTMFFVIPGMLFTIWFSLSHMIYITEGATGMDALLKSREYVRGYWWPVWLRLATVSFFVGLVNMLFGLITILIPSEQARNIVNIVMSFFLTPITLAYMLLIYENLRTVKGPVNRELSKNKKLTYIAIAVVGFILVMALFGWGIWAVIQMIQKNPSSNSNGVSNIWTQSNDVKRKGDIYTLQLTLSEYEDDEDSFPQTLDLLVPDYIMTVPQDPDEGSYDYQLIPGGDDYRLCTTYTIKGRVCVTSTTQPAL